MTLRIGQCGRGPPRPTNWQGILNWCERTLADSSLSHQGEIRQLRGLVKALLLTKKQGARRRMVEEIYRVMHAWQGDNALVVMAKSLTRPTSGTQGHSQKTARARGATKTSSAKSGATGESFALSLALARRGRTLPLNRASRFARPPKVSNAVSLLGSTEPWLLVTKTMTWIGSGFARPHQGEQSS